MLVQGIVPCKGDNAILLTVLIIIIVTKVAASVTIPLVRYWLWRRMVEHEFPQVSSPQLIVPFEDKPKLTYILHGYQLSTKSALINTF